MPEQKSRRINRSVAQAFLWGLLFLEYDLAGSWALGFALYPFGFGLWLGPLEFMVNGYHDTTSKTPPTAK